MTNRGSVTPTDRGGLDAPARLTLFGHPSTPLAVSLAPRTRAWRLLGAIRTGAIAAALAPVAFLVPPHAPWALAVLAAGGVLARRRWTERYTILGGTGRCPRCGDRIELPEGRRLKSHHTVPCDSCHHEPRLEVDHPATPG